MLPIHDGRRCSLLRRHEDKIVTRELQSACDGTDVRQRVQFRNSFGISPGKVANQWLI